MIAYWRKIGLIVAIIIVKMSRVISFNRNRIGILKSVWRLNGLEMSSKGLSIGEFMSSITKHLSTQSFPQVEPSKHLATEFISQSVDTFTHLASFKVHRTKDRMVDISRPHLWYPTARRMKRKLICHVGPTNSGKTYQALQRLMQAKTGAYCGPLRLLAWEVSEKLRQQGIKCSLVTGQERDEYPDDEETHVSSTVEMLNIGTQTACHHHNNILRDIGSGSSGSPFRSREGRHVDVAVIDEAQLIGDKNRGWAWTQAILGLACQEIHLCGSATMLPVIEQLVALTNDDLIVHQYKRLSPLHVVNKPLGGIQNIKSGDCVVGFSRKYLFELKDEIEKAKPGTKCCVVYGNLPPETRKEQARLFSDPDSGYNVLVASDAIGMGLNLAIKRIIFTTVEKFDGEETRLLNTSELKQIAGRAGRFNVKSSTSQDELDEDAIFGGEVLGMTKAEVSHIHSCLVHPIKSIDEPITLAGLSPTLELLKVLCLVALQSKHGEVLQRFFDEHESEKHYSLVPPPPPSRSTLQGQLASDESTSRKSVSAYLQLDALVSEFGSLTQFLDKLDAFLGVQVDEKALQFSKRRETFSMSKLWRMFMDMSALREDSCFFQCDTSDQAHVAEVVDSIDGLTLEEKFVLSKAPVNHENSELMGWYRHFVEVFANERVVSWPQRLEVKSFIPSSSLGLLKVETRHQIIDLYMWLAYQYPINFPDTELATIARDHCADSIDEGLKRMSERSASRSRKDKKEKGRRGHDRPRYRIMRRR